MDLLQLILDSAGEGVYGLDANGRTTFVNQAAERICGWRAEDVIGQPLHDIHHHSHVDGTPYPREECPIYRAIRDGQVHQVDDEVFWRTDGSSVPVEYTSTPIIEDGVICGAVVVFRDITARKEMEHRRQADFREITRLKEQLEQERDYLRDEINLNANFGEIIGDSQALKRTFTQIEAVAGTTASVLVNGESWDSFDKGSVSLPFDRTPDVAMIQIAFAELKRGRGTDALPMAERAAELAPNVPAAHLAVGRSRLAVGEVEGAVAAMEAAVGLAPENPRLHFALAQAYQQAGRTDDATREKQEFLRLEKASSRGGPAVPAETGASAVPEPAAHEGKSS